MEEPVDMAVTPEEERYVPQSVKKVLNIGHRSCTSGMMIEIALRMGLEQLLETKNSKIISRRWQRIITALIRYMPALEDWKANSIF